MKRIFYLFVLVSIFFSCKKEQTPPYTEVIKKGAKWGIQIGSSPAEVYVQLQKLSKEQSLYNVAVVGRKAFTSPTQLEALLPYYHFITLSRFDNGLLDRVVISFKDQAVEYIIAGNSLPQSTEKWPSHLPDEEAFLINDSKQQMYQKLKSLYQRPEFHTYELILSDKPLDLPFDPDMSHYNEWAFTFISIVSYPTAGQSQVRLIFKSGKLNQIIHHYSEHPLMDQSGK